MIIYYGDELFSPQKRIDVIGLVIWSFEGFGEVGGLWSISSD
jgi:hypothetical protein